jgi:hypothetical protein
LSVARLIDEEDGRFFEVSDGLRVLKKMQQVDPRLIRFGVKRGGGIRYMRIMANSGERR